MRDSPKKMYICDVCGKTAEEDWGDVPYGWYTLVAHFQEIGEGNILSHLCSAWCIEKAAYDGTKVGYHNLTRLKNDKDQAAKRYGQGSKNPSRRRQLLRFRRKD